METTNPIPADITKSETTNLISGDIIKLETPNLIPVDITKSEDQEGPNKDIEESEKIDLSLENENKLKTNITSYYMMDKSEAINILTALAYGKDPYNNTPLPPDSLYENPKTIRSLFLLLSEINQTKTIKSKKLENSDKDKKKADKQSNAGTKWTIDEESILINHYDAGTSVKDIAIKMKRSELALNLRLFKLGKISEKPQTPASWRR